MKKLLILALMLAVASCAKQPEQEVQPTGFLNKEASVTIAPKKHKKVVKTVSENKVDKDFYEFNNTNDDVVYNKELKELLEQKIKTNKAISELFEKERSEHAEEIKVTSLKQEPVVMEAPENLEPLNKELSLSEKLYNFTIKPIKKQILKWNIYINKEVPKYMREVKDNPSFMVILITLVASFIYGILHTIGPGHGKMVVATYFLTQKATVWQGVWLGLQTALAHVGGAIILVLLTDVALRSLVLDPAQHMYLLKNISFGLIIFVGLFMLLQAILHATGKVKNSACAHCNGHHHNHKKPTKRELLVALSIGCIPCTGSLLILLYAMAHNILAYGLLMVLFVALGMALTMIIIGLLAIAGKKAFLDKYLTEGKHAHKYSLGLEFVGALFIITVGLLMLSVNI